MPTVNIVFPEPLVEGAVVQVKDDEQVHFQNTVNRAVALGSDAEIITIHLHERTKPKTTSTGAVYDEGGWLEHLIVIKYVGGRQMVVGAIQRKVGAESEFHS